MAGKLNLFDVRYMLTIVLTGLVVGALLSAFYIAFDLVWGSIMPVILEQKRLTFLFTLLGLSLSFVLVYTFTPLRSTMSGTHVILEKYHLGSGQMSNRGAMVNPLAAFFTIALGGAAGLDGPAVTLGGGVASIFSRAFRFSPDRRKKTFLAGVAAGMASIFKAPLTAILFALEIPYRRDLEREAYVEVAIAAVSSYLITVALLGPQSIFGIFVQIPPITLTTIAATLLLSLICGLYAFLFVRTYNLADAVGKRFFARGGFGLLLLAGGVALGLIGYLDFNAIGPGYNLVTGLADQTVAYTLLGLVALLVLRLLSTTITLTFGGSGGLLIPSVVEGAVLGYLFSELLFGSANPLFVAVGIAAMVAATHKVILTPIAFVAETLGLGAVVPAVLGAVFANFVSGAQSFFPTQPYSKVKEEELALERIFTKVSKTSPSVLASLTVSDVMTHNPVTVNGGLTVEEALKVFEKVPYRVLPIVDEQKRPVGMIKLEDVATAPQRIMKIPISDLFSEVPFTVAPTTPLQEVASNMINAGFDHAFVVDEDYRLLGVVAGIDIARKLVHYYSVY
ncbi:MAG: chloride channel protein [Nitrososphaerota archaeon]|nr:chloride channel protein [Nitrososphaerota archaeon]